jgi:hypothetical protein
VDGVDVGEDEDVLAGLANGGVEVGLAVSGVSILRFDSLAEM